MWLGRKVGASEIINNCRTCRSMRSRALLVSAPEWIHFACAIWERQIKRVGHGRLYLCRGRWHPPSCPGGPCGTWRGSGDTPALEAVWRRATEVWRRPRSWKESGRVWGWTRGLCVVDSWFCRPAAPSPCRPPFCILPRWHTKSLEGGEEGVVREEVCQNNWAGKLTFWGAETNFLVDRINTCSLLGKVLKRFVKKNN